MVFIRLTIVAAMAAVTTGQCKAVVGGTVTINKMGDAFYQMPGTVVSINNALSAPFLITVAGKLGGKGYYKGSDLKC
ncbi:hypothetical protein H310_09937 [Aphanomyces invadans]|uniref:Uncharacterized protein n=1 Tax=Aphanomyces invadans TaxID=157072 RepID=A0A024TUV7_9STRA|nr:hypothetical protein H310_09937 [Aphanomyces invadans]ETV97132.1 hypothetical protein H310_09937 [Aphanomyces invadans]|eukprot:XP_008874378.1 hypothetical protein H310_09937 [Aphanomyces invadans]